ncbi:hypothetical protein ACHAW6_015143 [Cyclotella cf. meneghiniana]
MKANSEVEDRSTVCLLTPEECLMVHWKHDANSALVCTEHKQPALDSQVYEVCFPDGHSKELATNVIAEVLYAQCNGDSHELYIIGVISMSLSLATTRSKSWMARMVTHST